MLTDYFTKFDGSWKSPDQLGQKLDFTADGLIIWGSLSKATQFRLEKRLYGENDPEIDISLQDPKKAVILEVDHYHWVVAIGKNWFGRYKIIDPWFGDRASITRYHAITGSAHMILN